jgi:hypothetical protein
MLFDRKQIFGRNSKLEIEGTEQRLPIKLQRCTYTVCKMELFYVPCVVNYSVKAPRCLPSSCLRIEHTVHKHLASYASTTPLYQSFLYGGKFRYTVEN